MKKIRITLPLITALDLGIFIEANLEYGHHINTAIKKAASSGRDTKIVPDDYHEDSEDYIHIEAIDE